LREAVARALAADASPGDEVEIASPEALLIDCRSSRVERIHVPAAARFSVHPSGVRHADVEGGRAQRRAECEEAAAALGVSSLRDVDPGDRRLFTAATLVARAGDTGIHPRLAARARHVVSENARVLQFARRLREGDLDGCGALMNASHASQRDLFQVSVPEVDRLVERLRAVGAVGARLTGGGFGGSVVALWH
jgi:galactokinase